MTATAHLVTATHAGELTVPNAALRWRPPGAAAGGKRVYVLEGGRAVARDVTVGASDGTRTIVNGIDDATPVVIGSHP
jgi:HlyD family secretion protein